MENTSQNSSRSLKRKPSPLPDDCIEQKMMKIDCIGHENGELRSLNGEIVEEDKTKDTENVPGKIPESSETIEKPEDIEEKNDENGETKADISGKAEEKEPERPLEKDTQTGQREDGQNLDKEDKSTSVESNPDTDEPLEA